MKCFKCELEVPILFEEELHPDRGIHFFTFGHYGTTVFDPMDGTTLNIVICDTCLIIHDRLTKIK